MLDLDEQEQFDALKAWWKRYGTALMISVLVLVIAASAIQGWRYYQQRQATHASALFGVLQAVAQGGDVAKIREASGEIMSRYPSTAYAPRAALIAAHANYIHGNAKSAKAQLQWVIDHASEPALRDVARLRLARMLFDEKDSDRALALLAAKHGASFDALYTDLTGDILTARGQTLKAKRAYKTALAQLSQHLAYRKVVQIKLDALGTE